MAEHSGARARARARPTHRRTRTQTHAALMAFATHRGVLLRRNSAGAGASLAHVNVFKCAILPGDDVAAPCTALPTRLPEAAKTTISPTPAPSSTPAQDDLLVEDLTALQAVTRGNDNLPVADPPPDTSRIRGTHTLKVDKVDDLGNGFNRTAALTTAAAVGFIAVAIRSNPDMFAAFTETVGGARFVVAACMGVSAFLQALTGFGFAVVSVGGLSILDWVVNSNVFDTIQPLVATLGAATGWALLFPEIGRVEWGELIPVLVGSTLTLPAGVALASAVDTHVVLHLVGALVTAYVGYSLTGIKLPSVLGRPLGGWLLGGLAGTLGGAFDISGPPLVVHGEAAKWSTEDGTFKRNVLAVVTVNATLLVAYDAIVGRLDDVFYWDFLIHSIPAVVAGIVLGNMLSKRLDAAAFRKVVLGTCFVLGGKLLLS